MATNNLIQNIDSGRDPVNGTMRARVEDNRDPLKLGRVKVRIPSMHGVPVTDTKTDSIKVDDNSTTADTNSAVKIDKHRDEKVQQSQFLEVDDLPWAYPVSMSGAGAGHGSLIVPSIGDYVFVTFENGDRTSPIYFGGCFGIPKGPKQYGSLDPADHSNGSNAMNGIYTSGPGFNEAPNVYDSDGNPSTKVLFASEKGSSFIISDSAGNEQITMKDLAQQSISIYHPTGINDKRISISSGPSQSIQVIGNSNSGSGVELRSGFAYDEKKSLVKLAEDRTIISVGKNMMIEMYGDTITVTSPNIVLNGNVSIKGNLNVSGNVHGSGDIIASRKNSNHHTH